MYTNFFALKEVPFSIAPNPEYLFMSDRHQEALTHLTYGLGGTGSAVTTENSGGFVLLTGEVGTGKTTISRCLMQQLPENTQVAFILNPTLSSQELLATICDEFKVRYRKTGATLKTLTDKIQEKLLKNHEQNINTLLIIDEAQHLQPEVLEQLRLLTNLETNTKKLLQVILIGQPELQQLLQRRDLRQLAQRITARYHLLPLNLQEVQQYIKHRLSVADCHRALFDIKAIKEIHKISQGIPRLINLLCHKALMLAYNQNSAVVTKKLVSQAAVEALGDEYASKPSKLYALLLPSLAISLVAVVSVLVGVMLVDGTNDNGSDKDNVKVESVAFIEPKKKPVKHEQIDSQQQQVAALQAQLVQLQQQQLALQAKQAEQEKQRVVSVKPEMASPQPLLKPASKPVNQVQQPLTFDATAVDGVSNDLLARFKSAIQAENEQGQKSIDTVDNIADADSVANEILQQEALQVRPISQMPAWVQQGVPTLSFEQHIYASDGQGWVRVNGKDRRAGEQITSDLTLVDILPQKVILNYRGEKFSLPALTNW